MRNPLARRHDDAVDFIESIVNGYMSGGIYDDLTYPQFEAPEYRYGNVINQFAPGMEQLMRFSGDIGDMVPYDPYEKSECRDGLKIWDAVIACGRREASISRLNEVASSRNTNKVWSDETCHSLNNIRRGTDGLITRPEGAFITDLVTRKGGWKILELAHALSHLEYDTRISSKPDKYDIGLMSNGFATCLAKICASIEFGIPIDVKPNKPAEDTNDGFEKYGIKICSSCRFRNPVLTVDAIGDDSPVPDETVAVLCAGVHIEPHPHGADDSGNGKWLELNRWSCEPTMVALAGWETVDVLTRAQFVPIKGSIGYAMRPQSLEPMTEFMELISCAEASRGKAVPDNDRYWLVEELIDKSNDDSFYRIISHAPPLPCASCTQLNGMTDGAPERPRVSRDDFGWEEEWNKWLENTMKYVSMSEKAVKYYEAGIYGATKAREFREEREKTYKDKSRLLSQLSRLNDRLSRACDKGDPDKELHLCDLIDEKKAELDEMMER